MPTGIDSSRMLDIAPAIGVGVSDLQQAVRAEVDRISKETKGDELAQCKLLFGMLRERDLLTETEVTAMSRLAEVVHEVGAGKTSARDAYFESRDVYTKLLADGKASPAALVLASSAVGSYSIKEDPDGSGVVIFLANNGTWASRGAALGEAIGFAIGGATGALIGGEIGGAIGAAVDECLK
jgi:hypothetical protein